MTAVAWTHTIAHPGTRGRGWTCCWHPERHRGRHREARAGHPRGRAATRHQEHLSAILQPPPHTPRFALQTWNRSGSADLPPPSARAGDTAGIGVTTRGPARCCGQTGGTHPPSPPGHPLCQTDARTWPQSRMPAPSPKDLTPSPNPSPNHFQCAEIPVSSDRRHKAAKQTGAEPLLGQLRS